MVANDSNVRFISREELSQEELDKMLFEQANIKYLGKVSNNVLMVEEHIIAFTRDCCCCRTELRMTPSGFNMIINNKEELRRCLHSLADKFLDNLYDSLHETKDQSLNTEKQDA